MTFYETFTLRAQCMSVSGLIFPICTMGSTGLLRVSINHVSFIGLSLSLKPIVHRWAENTTPIYPDKVGMENEAHAWRIQLELSIEWLAVRVCSSEEKNLAWRQIRLVVEIISFCLVIEAMRDEITQRLFKLRKGRDSNGQCRRTGWGPESQPGKKNTFHPGHI